AGTGPDRCAAHPTAFHRRHRALDPAVRRSRRVGTLARHRDSTVARGRPVSPTASYTAHHPSETHGLVECLIMATDWLLSQNERMKKQGIFNWTLPAWVVQLTGTAPDGTTTVRRVNVCPSAGVCAKHCYALGSDSGYIRFPAARARHLRNLRMVLDTPLLWQERMATELRHPRYQPDPEKGKVGHIRIHDAGDFFDDAYTLMWLEIMR